MLRNTLRFFKSPGARSISFVSINAERTTKLSKEIINKLGVQTISGPLKIIENPKPVEINTVAPSKLRLLLGEPVSKRQIKKNAEQLKLSQRHGVGWG